MNNYTIEIYGWTLDAKAKSIAWIIARGVPLIIKFYKTCVPLVQKM